MQITIDIYHEIVIRQFAYIYCLFDPTISISNSYNAASELFQSFSNQINGEILNENLLEIALQLLNASVTTKANLLVEYGLEFDSSKNLIACGIFEKLQDDSKFLSNIAKWNGTIWNSVGNGIHDSSYIYGILLSNENEIIIGSNNPIKPINAYYNDSSYISKISNSYVNLNYNNEKLITQYYDGQSTSIKTVKNNSSNKKVGFVYPNSYNITETYV